MKEKISTLASREENGDGHEKSVGNDFGMHYNYDKPLQVYYRRKKGSNIGYKGANTCN